VYSSAVGQERLRQAPPDGDLLQTTRNDFVARVRVAVEWQDWSIYVKEEAGSADELRYNNVLRGRSQGSSLRRNPRLRDPANKDGSANEYEIAIYNSNVAVTRTFWNWRHRVLTLYLSLITAIGAIIAWLAQQTTDQKYLCLPLIAASGISLIAFFWEQRVREIIGLAIKSCAETEQRWQADNYLAAGRDGSSINSTYSIMYSSRQAGHVGVFSVTIPILFGVIGGVSLVLACLIFAASP
jgi:hypothetical protein